MNKYLGLVLGLVLCAFTAFAVQDVASALEGMVKKIDAGAKTVVVKTADGTEHTFHVVHRTAVHGTEATASVPRAIVRYSYEIPPGYAAASASAESSGCLTTSTARG